MEMHSPYWRIRKTAGSEVLNPGGITWHLKIPAGSGDVYRLAQLDDYSALPRHRLPWTPPFQMRLRARVSEEALPGTWGFGLWNDPFSLSLGLGGMSRRLPALPNAAWFFYASPPNYLSFRDDLPAQGMLVATFSAPKVPSWLLLPASVGLPLAFLPGVNRLLRRVVRKLVLQEAIQLKLDPTTWHDYRLEWNSSAVRFHVDQDEICVLSSVPRSPLGLVIWIDNQYAAWTPDARLRYGFLANPRPAWLEIEGFEIVSAAKT